MLILFIINYFFGVLDILKTHCIIFRKLFIYKITFHILLTLYTFATILSKTLLMLKIFVFANIIIFYVFIHKITP